MKKRLFWIDVIRVIGMIGVITIHVIGNTINTLGLSGRWALIYTVICKSCYFVLPLFVMLSGALLLNKDISYRDIFLKYIRRMVFILLIFGGAFAFMEEFFVNREINAGLVLKIFKRILENGLWDHMWYIYLLIALYLITPLLRKFIKNSNSNEQFNLLVILFIFTILIKDLGNLLKIDFAFYVPISSGFVFVYLLGNYLFNNKLSNNYKKVLNISGLLSCILIIMLTFFNKCNYLIGYTSSLCIMVAASLFVKLKDFKIKNKNIKKLVISLGECSLGIYILHQFFINIIYKVLKIDIILDYPYIFLFVYILGILIITYIVVYIIRKSNFIKKYIL